MTVVDAGALYADLRQEVYVFLRRRVGNYETAEDLTADVFMRVVESADRYEDRGSAVGAWVGRIARNLLTDFYRHQAVEERVIDPTVSLSDEVVRRATLDAGSEHHATQLDLVAAIQSLPPRYRTAITAQQLEGMNLRDVALAMGTTVDSVKKLSQRASATLRERLGDVA